MRLLLSHPERFHMAEFDSLSTFDGSSYKMLYRTDAHVGLFIIPFQALMIGSYCGDAAPITPSCIINRRSSRIALCSTIISTAILEICAAWYEKMLLFGGMPKKSPVCLPVTIIINTTRSFEAIH